MHNVQQLATALEKALGESAVVDPPKITKGTVKLHVDGLDRKQVDSLHAFRDEYRPSNLHLKRSGTGITIVVTP